jgi:hypothetical protein
MAGADPLVMVVNCDGEGAFCGLLADHVFLQEVENFPGFGQFEATQVRYLRELLFDDFIAEFDTFVADVDTGTGNELADLLLAFAAERALQ